MFSLAQAHNAFDSEGSHPEPGSSGAFETNIVNFMDAVEVSNHYACLKRAWVERKRGDRCRPGRAAQLLGIDPELVSGHRVQAVRSSFIIRSATVRASPSVRPRPSYIVISSACS
jgi:hypothetical protein